MEQPLIKSTTKKSERDKMSPAPHFDLINWNTTLKNFDEEICITWHLSFSYFLLISSDYLSNISSFYLKDEINVN